MSIATPELNITDSELLGVHRAVQGQRVFNDAHGLLMLGFNHLRPKVPTPGVLDIALVEVGSPLLRLRYAEHGIYDKVHQRWQDILNNLLKIPYNKMSTQADVLSRVIGLEEDDERATFHQFFAQEVLRNFTRDVGVRLAPFFGEDPGDAHNKLSRCIRQDRLQDETDLVDQVVAWSDERGIDPEIALPFSQAIRKHGVSLGETFARPNFNGFVIRQELGQARQEIADIIEHLQQLSVEDNSAI